jgi:uncharacterized membrane protein
MRTSIAFVLVVCASPVAADGRFIALQTPGIQASSVAGNGRYVSAEDYGASGVRWSAVDDTETLIPGIQGAIGINDAGTIAGTVFINGGAYAGGQHVAAIAAIGAEPVQLDRRLATHSIAFDITDDGTVVGQSFESPSGDDAVAFIWTAADGMIALPVPRPQHPSCATSVSADGRVIAGWNGTDGGARVGVIWIDGVVADILDADDIAVGEAWDVSADGNHVVGGRYTDIDGASGGWRWNAETGVVRLPGMSFATGISGDGRTAVGGTDPFAIPPIPIRSLVWREGIGTLELEAYLAEMDIDVPAGWGFGQGLADISDDGDVLAGWGIGPLGVQSYVVRIVGDAIFEDGFESAAR